MKKIKTIRFGITLLYNALTTATTPSNNLQGENTFFSLLTGGCNNRRRSFASAINISTRSSSSC